MTISRGGRGSVAGSSPRLFRYWDAMVIHRPWWGSGAGGVWGVTIEGE